MTYDISCRGRASAAAVFLSEWPEGSGADSGAGSAKNDLKRETRRNVILFSCIAGALLISAAIVAAALARTNKKKER